MTTIWKSILHPTDVQEVMVPDGAEFLCAREQFDQICVWYRCDPSAPLSPRTLAIVGTGHPTPGIDGQYLGTVSLTGGQFIFHVFDLQPTRILT